MRLKRGHGEGSPYPSRRDPVDNNDLTRVLGTVYTVSVYQSYLPRDGDIVDRATYDPTSREPFSHSGLKLEIGMKFKQTVEQFRVIAGDLDGEQRVKAAVEFMQTRMRQESGAANHLVDNVLMGSLERSMKRGQGGFLERAFATAFLLKLDGTLPEDSIFVAKGRIRLAGKVDNEKLERIEHNATVQLLRDAGDQQPLTERRRNVFTALMQTEEKEVAETIADIEKQNSLLNNRLKLYTEGVEAAWLEIRLPGEKMIIAEPWSGRVARSAEGEVFTGTKTLSYGSLPITVLTPLQ